MSAHCAFVQIPAIPIAHALQPSSNQQHIVSVARSLRIYSYDVEPAGLQPPLSAFSAHSCACIVQAHSVSDLCNHGFGRPSRRRFASALQGTVWSNHNGATGPITSAAYITRTNALQSCAEMSV